MRRYVAILASVCFAASVAGVPLALHLHVWYGQHGHGARHDESQCPVVQATLSSSQAVVGDGPTAVCEVDLGPWGITTVPQSRPVETLDLSSAPRAPPLIHLRFVDA